MANKYFVAPCVDESDEFGMSAIQEFCDSLSDEVCNDFWAIREAFNNYIDALARNLSDMEMREETMPYNVDKHYSPEHYVQTLDISIYERSIKTL